MDEEEKITFHMPSGADGQADEANLSNADLQTQLASANAFISDNLAKTSQPDLQKRLQRARLDLSQLGPVAPRQIAVIGPSGTGKSSLINSLVGAEVVPSSGRVKSCTQANISVTNTPGSPIQITIQYRSREEWAKMKLAFLDFKAVRAAERGKSDAGIWNQIGRTPQLRALYPPSHIQELVTIMKARQDEDHKQTEAEAEMLKFEPEEANNLFGSQIVVSVDSVEEILSLISPFVLIPAHPVCFQPWPLVSAIDISAPFPAAILPPYVTLCDTPGLEDQSRKVFYEEEAKDFVKKEVSEVWFVASERPGTATFILGKMRELACDGIKWRVVVTKVDGNKEMNTNPQTDEEKKKNLDFQEAENESLREEVRNHLCDDQDLGESSEHIVANMEVSWVSCLHNYGLQDLGQVLMSRRQKDLALLRSRQAQISKIMAPLERQDSIPIEDLISLVESAWDQQLTSEFDPDFKDLFALKKTATRVIIRQFDQCASGIAYNTWQKIMSTEDGWSPSIALCIANAILEDCDIETRWITLFNKTLPEMFHEFGVKQQEAIARLIEIIARHPVFEQKIVSLKETGELLKQEEALCLEEALNPIRRGLKKTVRLFICDKLREGDCFRYFEGLGCKVAMLNWMRTKLCQILPDMLGSLGKFLQDTISFSLIESWRKLISSRNSHLSVALSQVFGVPHNQIEHDALKSELESLVSPTATLIDQVSAFTDDELERTLSQLTPCELPQTREAKLMLMDQIFSDQNGRDWRNEKRNFQAEVLLLVRSRLQTFFFQIHSQEERAQELAMSYFSKHKEPNTFAKMWKALYKHHYPLATEENENRANSKILVLGMGFGTERQYNMLLEAGFGEVRCIYDASYDPGHPKAEGNWIETGITAISKCIADFAPHAILCASRGGFFLVELWKRKIWQGPSLMINSHPALFHNPKMPKGGNYIPDETPFVLACGSNEELKDFQFTREVLDGLMSGPPDASFPEHSRYLYYTCNSRTHVGDKHNMITILNNDCLPRLVDAVLSKEPGLTMPQSANRFIPRPRREAEQKLGYAVCSVQRFWTEAKQVLVPVPLNSQEFNYVQALFETEPGAIRLPRSSPSLSLKNRIQSIERIQNIRQETCAAFGLQEAKLNTPQFIGGLHVRWVFHGTTHEAVQSIAQDPVGFRMSKAGVNGQIWGNGIYFARDAAFAHDYALPKPPPIGQRKMFLCLIQTGLSCQGQVGLEKPYRYKNIRFDSSVDSLSNPEIFILEEEDAWPCYVITYA